VGSRPKLPPRTCTSAFTPPRRTNEIFVGFFLQNERSEVDAAAVRRGGDARRGATSSEAKPSLDIFQQISKKCAKYVAIFVSRSFFVSKNSFVSFPICPSPSDTGNLPVSVSPARELPESGIGTLQIGRDQQIKSWRSGYIPPPQKRPGCHAIRSSHEDWGNGFSCSRAARIDA